MTTTRNAAARKRATRTPTGKAKAKVKSAARKAKRSLDVAAHDAELALSRTTRKLQGAAQKIDQKVQQAKAPARKHARRVERNVVSALENAGDLIAGVVRKAKKQLAAVTKKTIG
jgi:hypothetical protein